MPAENNVSTAVETKTDANGKKIPTETKEYTGLKTFLKTALPKLKQVVIDMIVVSAKFFIFLDLSIYVFFN